jgi:hypothetical protein
LLGSIVLIVCHVGSITAIGCIRILATIVLRILCCVIGSGTWAGGSGCLSRCC